jgi:hypothetical protein
MTTTSFPINKPPAEDTAVSLLRLRAEDSHDLKIMSCCLQDAFLPATAIHYSSEDKIFALLVNRFMWEQEPEIHDGHLLYKRVHSGLYFSHVSHVRHWNIDQQNATDLLNLLAIHGDKDGEIHLLFSGEKQICLHVEKLLCHLKDLHEPWYTPQKPAHPL